MSKHTTNGASIVKQLKEIQGLFSCFLEHQVTKTTCQFKWDGPKIPESEWNKMLAFFQWSYDTTKSETQVRLYVNKVTQTWSIWAYPQEARTGMSAKELEDHEKFQEQRLQFNPDEGWIYFGTVHHHCGMNAFQSGTDEANEKGQDGIHITVGNLDAKRYSIHDRFYLNGAKIDHDLSWFWDIGNVMESVPDWAARLLPENIKDRIARGQMCEKAPEGTEFPEVWKDNLIYRPPPPVHYVGGLGYNPTVGGITRYQRKAQNLHFDLAEAREQLLAYCVTHKLEELDIVAEMQAVLKNDQVMVDLIELMYRNDVTLEKFTEYCSEELVKEMDAAAKVRGEKKYKKHMGIPDYEGNKNFGDGML